MPAKETDHDMLPVARKIAAIEEQSGRLSPLQKVLLSTDGSVTSILEMVTGSQVSIRTRAQYVRPAEPDEARILKIVAGEEVNYREVDIVEGESGKVLIHAVSRTPLSRLAPSFQQDLMQADIPIGRIIRRHRLETRREITDVAVGEAGADEAENFGICEHEPMLSRDYRIIHEQQTLIAIRESFPFNCFTDERRVIIQAPARIHLGLIDMNGSLGRVDGGIGLALEEPSTLLEARRSEGLAVIGGDEDTRRRAEAACRQMLSHLGIEGGVELTLRRTLTSHAGLGSGTQMALASAAAVCGLFAREFPPATLAAVTGRGGTSGIGTAAFAAGGFIVDGGHHFGPGRDKSDFRPSSASGGVKVSPVVARLDFPEDWQVVIATPAAARGASGAREHDIFRTHCPVPSSEVGDICREIVMRLLPGIQDHDLDLFGRSVNRLQELGFKKVEQSIQHPRTAALMGAMCAAGAACAGLSSFGPTVFAVTDTGAAAVGAAAREVLAGTGGEVVVTRACNSGARIRAA